MHSNIVLSNSRVIAKCWLTSYLISEQSDKFYQSFEFGKQLLPSYESYKKLLKVVMIFMLGYTFPGVRLNDGIWWNVIEYGGIFDWMVKSGGISKNRLNGGIWLIWLNGGIWWNQNKLWLLFAKNLYYQILALFRTQKSPKYLTTLRLKDHIIVSFMGGHLVS